MSKQFFTADFHLWHKKILVLADRRFSDIEAHNQIIQDNINRVVRKDDHLTILGDLAMGPATRLSQWLDGIKTKNLNLVWGNHDDTAQTLVKRQPGRFKRVGDILTIKAHLPGRPDPVSVVCCHYAMRVWNKSHYGTYHVYGHSHGSLPDDLKTRSMDVGVDTNNYCPWELIDIVSRLDKRNYVPVDHHKGVDALPGEAACGLCLVSKMNHKPVTLNCPVSVENGDLTYHQTQYFAPRRVL